MTLGWRDPRARLGGDGEREKAEGASADPGPRMDPMKMPRHNPKAKHGHKGWKRKDESGRSTPYHSKVTTGPWHGPSLSLSECAYASDVLYERVSAYV